MQAIDINIFIVKLHAEECFALNIFCSGDVYFNKSTIKITQNVSGRIAVINSITSSESHSARKEQC